MALNIWNIEKLLCWNSHPSLTIQHPTDLTKQEIKKEPSEKEEDILEYGGKVSNNHWL